MSDPADIKCNFMHGAFKQQLKVAAFETDEHLTI
jgi:hypothetical protein